MLIRKIKSIKKRELRDQVGNLAVFLPINIGLHNTHWGGAILHFWKETQENPKPKIFPRNQDKSRPPPLAFDFFFSSPTTLFLYKRKP
jgi:hypothetical protein